jgi:hypothetical protein
MANERFAAGWSPDRDKGDNTVELLIPLGLLAVWIILQLWVLPRLGVKT